MMGNYLVRFLGEGATATLPLYPVMPQWLADVLRHGLLTASFIPPAPIREMRDLVRYRKTLVQERARSA